MNTVNKPTWLYKPVDHIVDLEKIQKEFYKIFTSFYRDIFNEGDHDIVLLDTDLVKKLAPNYVKFLKSVGLWDMFIGVAFSGSKGLQVNKCPIHIDTKYWEQLSYALNIPITGCENSYTVFYQVTDKDGVENDTKVTSRYEGSIGYPDASSTEIGRMPANQPAWINVSMPHRPITDHSDLRLLITTRFNTQIFEYFNHENI